jgi:hypothetical protein
VRPGYRASHATRAAPLYPWHDFVMDVLFLDDSDQKGLRKGMGKLLAVGGALFQEEALLPFQDRMESICSDFDLPASTEVKWSPPPGNPVRKLKAHLRRDLYSRILEAALDARAVGLVVVFDGGRMTLKGTKR